MNPREVAGRAPTRIDLGGGWTDVPPYCDREGGFVCNVAISRYAIARLREARFPTPVGAHSASSAGGGSESDRHDAPLVTAALKRSGVDDVRVTIENDFPVGAGLGGSSAASAAMLGALAAWQRRTWDPLEIAEEGRRIEVEELGVPGGRQDHYAATHGGALALTFTDRVRVERLAITEATKRELVSRATLVYTGESRISGDTITAVLSAYQAKEAHVLRALKRMRELAVEMATALKLGDIDALGGLVGEHWEHQRSLHPSIPTPHIDEIVARSRAAGALGAKAMGASGGGCVLVIARPGGSRDVREAVRPLGQILDFDIDESGLTVLGAAA